MFLRDINARDVDLTSHTLDGKYDRKGYSFFPNMNLLLSDGVAPHPSIIDHRIVMACVNPPAHKNGKRRIRKHPR